MSRDKEELLERLAKSIETIQRIHNDSRTPLSDAIALVEPIRELDRCRDDLRKAAFHAETSNAKFNTAVSRLEKINDTLKADVIAHARTMDFVKDATAAAAAVLDLAIAVAGTASLG